MKMSSSEKNVFLIIFFTIIIFTMVRREVLVEIWGRVAGLIGGAGAK